MIVKTLIIKPVMHQILSEFRFAFIEVVEVTIFYQLVIDSGSSPEFQEDKPLQDSATPDLIRPPRGDAYSPIHMSVY